MRGAVLTSAVLLAACTERAPLASDFVPDYLGAEITQLAGDLVQVEARMTKARTAATVFEYADCAVASFMQEDAVPYARYVRSNFDREGGVWAADVVYITSVERPRGIRVIDAAAVAAHCRQKRIPTV
ncbi:hypothetical protein [Roseobacter sinensis]|uniref:Lipoprotein n=1 Tax=Roseobacter sinensis TaxID=2931391 RepID=A0ABT3BFY9_9RHOB|nr:hypothetical protein [Roseobacter sp. WL0113]MCV3272465.1 hypothetical protein [Roseobacter sp. WL0113]